MSTKNVIFSNPGDVIDFVKIVEKYPTPFHIYDEKGIRENAKALKEAFAWNKGYKEFFAVKATPNPFLINILREYGCGCDCSSLTELMLSNAMGVKGEDIMFSSNDTPAHEFEYAAKIGATINLDDITHIDFLEKTIGYLPKTLSCRYNPGGYFSISNNIMDNPGDSKYGFTTEQMFEGYRILKEKGVKNIFVDTDGDFNRLIPQFIAAGVDGFLPMDVNAGMDIVKVRELYPRLKFIGGFNKLVIEQGKDAIDREFERILPVIRSGGYVPGCDHQATPDSTLEDYKYYIRRLKEVMEESGAACS